MDNRHPILVLMVVMLFAIMGCAAPKQAASKKSETSTTAASSSSSKTQYSSTRFITDETHDLQVKLSLALPRQDYISGMDYYAEATVSNLSGRDLLLGSTGGKLKIIVINDRNQVVWPKEPPPLPGSTVEALAKDQGNSIRALFRVEEPGTYRVLASLDCTLMREEGLAQYEPVLPLTHKTEPIVISVEPGEDGASNKASARPFKTVWLANNRDSERGIAQPFIAYDKYAYAADQFYASEKMSLSGLTYIGSYEVYDIFSAKDAAGVPAKQLWSVDTSKEYPRFNKEILEGETHVSALKRIKKFAGDEIVPTISSSTSTAGLQLTIELPHRQLDALSDHRAKITLANKSGKDLELWTIYDLFNVKIVDIKGNTVWPDPNMGKPGVDRIVLKHGRSISRTSTFMIDAVGTYRILCSTHDYERELGWSNKQLRHQSFNYTPIEPPKLTVEPITFTTRVPSSP